MIMWSSEGSFARKQLEKHGWTDGAGLGANEHGITQAIKVKLKMDTAGVGHDPAKEFTHHWWDDAFNKAASNITVEANEDGVMVKSSKKSNKDKATAQKKAQYGNFVKTSLLSNGIEQEMAEEVTHNNEEKDLSSKKPQTLLLPEDELFKRCGGRTAHKAARHGLKLNGKLQRIEEQEKLLLQKYESQNSSPPHQHKSVTGNSRQHKDTHHNLSSDEIRQNDPNVSHENGSPKEPSSEDLRQEKKKKKKKDKRKQDFTEDKEHRARACQKCESMCSCNVEKENGLQLPKESYCQEKVKSSKLKDKSMHVFTASGCAAEEERSFEIKKDGCQANTKLSDSTLLSKQTEAASAKKRKKSKRDSDSVADSSFLDRNVDDGYPSNCKKKKKKKSRKE